MVALVFCFIGVYYACNTGKSKECKCTSRVSFPVSLLVSLSFFSLLVLCSFISFIFTACAYVCVCVCVVCVCGVDIYGSTPSLQASSVNMPHSMHNVHRSVSPPHSCLVSPLQPSPLLCSPSSWSYINAVTGYIHTVGPCRCKNGTMTLLLITALHCNLYT